MPLATVPCAQEGVERTPKDTVMNWFDWLSDIVLGLIDLADAIAWWRFWLPVLIAMLTCVAVWFLVPTDALRIPIVVVIGLTGLAWGGLWQWRASQNDL